MARSTGNGVHPDATGSSERRWALLATSLGFAVVQLDVSVVNVAIKPIGAELGGGVSDLQWVVSAYTVAFAALILSAGALGDRIGAKRVFIGGFLMFTLASAACGSAPSLGVLIATRAIQGIGAALLVPCSLTLLNHAYSEPEERERAVGLWAAGASVALSAGPLIGGVLTSALSWRAIFFINAPLGALGIWLTFRYASDTSRSTDRGLDLGGQAAAMLALVALTGAMIEGGVKGFASAPVLAGFALAVVAAGCFLVREARSAKPMLPLALFRSRAFSAATTTGLLVNIAFYGLIFVLSLFFQRAQHRSPLETGLLFAPMTGVVMAANVLAGRLARWVGPGRTIVLGSLSMAVGAVALLGVARTSSYPSLLAQLVLLGFGIGLIVPAMTSVQLGSVEQSRSGIASGTLNTARQAGSVVGVALFGSLISSDTIGGLHAALAICVGLAAAGAMLGAVIQSSLAHASR